MPHLTADCILIIITPCKENCTAVPYILLYCCAVIENERERTLVYYLTQNGTVIPYGKCSKIPTTCYNVPEKGIESSADLDLTASDEVISTSENSYNDM